jgi:hypothetical protein
MMSQYRNQNSQPKTNGPNGQTPSIRHGSWFVNTEGHINKMMAPGVHLYLIEVNDPDYPVAVMLCPTDASREYDDDQAIQVGRGRWMTSQGGRDYLFCLYDDFFLKVFFIDESEQKENGAVAFSYVQEKPRLQKSEEEVTNRLSNARAGKVHKATPAGPNKEEQGQTEPKTKKSNRRKPEVKVPLDDRAERDQGETEIAF